MGRETGSDPAVLGRAAELGVIVFVAIVVSEHALDPSLAPATHEISEYVHSPAGAVMVVGFGVWMVSLAATSVVARAARFGPLLWGSLAVAAAGMLLTATFATETSAGRLPPGAVLTLSGRLHDLGSGATTAALVVAALASSAQRALGRPFRRRAAALLATALVGDLALLAVGPAVGGIRQRLLVGAGCAWQILFLRAVRVDRSLPPAR